MVSVDQEVDDDILQGVLGCPATHCQREFPIIDGIPLLVADLRQYVSDQLPAISGRRDLSADLESILGDCCGPGSGYDVLRQQVSAYGFDHYGDLDPQSEPHERPGAILELLEAVLELLPPAPAGPIIDLGCGVGRTTFELAERFDRPVLGIDLNFAMLRLAAQVLREGRASYPLRQLGVVYDRRTFPISFVNSKQVDFWACDLQRPPFGDRSFALAGCLNALDCVAEPHRALREIERILGNGGLTWIASPFDWSPAATPYEQWLGGHSQRGPASGRSEIVLRDLLNGSPHPAAIGGLEILAEKPSLPWRVRSHSRSTVEYRVHLLVAQAIAS